MSTKRVLVTGCTPGGIGLETAIQMAKLGHSVMITCRTPQLAEEAARLAKTQASVAIKPIPTGLDLEVRSSIEGFASKFKEPIDILINNAGVMGIQSLEISGFGVEKTVAINHVGTFLLTRLLEPNLLSAASSPKSSGKISRVVNVSSDALLWIRDEFSIQEAFKPESFDSTRQYALSKLFNSLHATELNIRWRNEKKPLIATAVHPGVIATNLARSMPSVDMSKLGQWKPISLEEGSRTSIFAALSDLDPKDFPIYYFRNAGKAKKLTEPQKDLKSAENLRVATEKLLNLPATGVKGYL